MACTTAEKQQHADADQAPIVAESSANRSMADGSMPLDCSQHTSPQKPHRHCWCRYSAAADALGTALQHASRSAVRTCICYYTCKHATAGANSLWSPWTSVQLLSEKAQANQERLQPRAPVPVCEGSMRGAPARRSWSGSSRPQLCTLAHRRISMLSMRARHSSRLSSCEAGAAACASVSGAGATCSAGEVSMPRMHVKLRRDAPSAPCKTSCCAQPCQSGALNHR
jgi:hypothetical protein